MLVCLLAALGCAALLLYVSFEIAKSKDRISWTNAVYGVGMFNYSNQQSHNIFRFTDALHRYRMENDDAARQQIKKQYIGAFDILWSSSVSLRQIDNLENKDTVPEVRVLKERSRSMLKSTDPLIKTEVDLSDSQILKIIDEFRELFLLSIKAGNSHFSQYSFFSDEVNRGFENLQSVFRFLIVTFSFLLGTSMFLLWRMLKRERKQAQDIQTAHNQLTVLVDDLRSGQAEKRARNQFLAAASHDLRQPLHALGLFLDSLEKNVNGKEGHLLLEKIRSSTGALNGLFNSLLDISRLDAGVVEINRSPVSLQQLFSDIQKEYSDTAIQYGAELEINDTDAVVYTDTVLLQRILRNLIENSLLHAPGSTITLQAATAPALKNNDGSLAASDGSTNSTDATSAEPLSCVIQVSDTGPGIPESQHELVFSEYYQLQNPERDRNKGLGLGLSIVKRLADLLGHDLTLVSSSGQGTTFTLALPLGDPAHIKQEAPKTSAQETPLPDLQGLNVLVIEDEVDIRTGMEVTLGNAGCKVLASESAESARQLVVKTNQVPDIIIADYRLRDDKTGSDAVELICEELNRDIPAFLITGDTSPVRVREASATGIRLLHKPVLPNELFTVIREVVSGADQSTASTGSPAVNRESA